MTALEQWHEASGSPSQPGHPLQHPPDVFIALPETAFTTVLLQLLSLKQTQLMSHFKLSANGRWLVSLKIFSCPQIPLPAVPAENCIGVIEPPGLAVAVLWFVGMSRDFNFKSLSQNFEFPLTYTVRFGSHPELQLYNNA